MARKKAISRQRQIEVIEELVRGPRGVIELAADHGFTLEQMAEILADPENLRVLSRLILGGDLQTQVLLSQYRTAAVMRLIEQIGPAIEMGRSFVQPAYQREFTSLMLLWKGICRFLSRNPRYRVLFGPVKVPAHDDDHGHDDEMSLGTTTIGGMEVTAWQGHGSVEPGKRADLIAIDLQSLNLGRFFQDDPAPLVVYSARPINVDLVMVEGELQKQGGELVDADVDRALGEARASIESIRHRID